MALLHLALFLRLYPSKSHVQLLEKAQLQFIHKERAVLRRSARLPWAVILALTPPRTRAGAYFLIAAYSSAMLGTRARIGSLPVVVPTAYARARGTYQTMTAEPCLGVVQRTPLSRLAATGGC